MYTFELHKVLTIDPISYLKTPSKGVENRNIVIASKGNERQKKTSIIVKSINSSSLGPESKSYH